jgi:hypothetical protein
VVAKAGSQSTRYLLGRCQGFYLCLSWVGRVGTPSVLLKAKKASFTCS